MDFLDDEFIIYDLDEDTPTVTHNEDKAQEPDDDQPEEEEPTTPEEEQTEKKPVEKRPVKKWKNKKPVKKSKKAIDKKQKLADWLQSNGYVTTMQLDEKFNSLARPNTQKKQQKKILSLNDLNQFY